MAALYTEAIAFVMIMTPLFVIMPAKRSIIAIWSIMGFSAIVIIGYFIVDGATK